MKTAVVLATALLIGASLAPADSSGKLTVYMGGKPVANESYSIQSADGKIEINGSGAADMGILKITIDQFKVVTDARYHPLEAAAKAQMGKVNMAILTTFSDDKANNKIDSGQGPTSKEDAIHGDDLVINTNLPICAWSMLFPRVKLDSTTPQEFHAYIIGQKEVPLTVTSKGKETVEFDGKSEELSHVAASLPLQEDKTTDIDFWINDAGKIIKAVVPSQSVEVYQQGYAPKPKPAPAEGK
ncbi:MAG TPA: hypothetical protein VKU01_11790 [Bryobacteraceae bacterium]|nr:hypothetical protein [Bryobacteraceae bacterium]